RFTLPRGLNTTAQPRLGRRPPLTAVLTNKHHPQPALDNIAERPEVPGRPGHVQRLIQVLLEPGPVGVRQGGTDQLDPLGQVGTNRRLGTAHHVPRVQTSLPLRPQPTCLSWPPYGDSAGIRSNPRPGRCCTKAHCSLRRLRVESRANGEVSSVMASAMRVRS